MIARSSALLAVLFLAACHEAEPASSADMQEASATPALETTTTIESPTEPAPVAAAPTKRLEISYEIDVEAAGAHLPALCDGGLTVYNDCSGEPLALAWKDVGDKAPKSVRIELGISLFCGDPLVDLSFPQRHGVSVNDGSTFGGFDGDLSACTCSAPTTTHTFDMTAAALTAYRVGGDNTLHVNGKNRCIGVGPLAGGTTVARIVATY